jgi:hypothetical protein
LRDKEFLNIQKLNQVPFELVVFQIYRIEAKIKYSVEIVLKAVIEKFSNVKEVNEKLEVYFGEDKCYYTAEIIDNYLILTSIITPSKEDLSKRENILNQFDISDPLSKRLEAELNKTYITTIYKVTNLDKEIEFIEDYSEDLLLKDAGLSRVGNNLVLLENLRESEYTRNCIIIQLSTKDDKVTKFILEDLKLLSILHNNISKINEKSKGIISVLESGQKEINVKIEEFLWKLLRTKSLKIEELESWLSYIMERMSTTTTILNSLKLSQAEASVTEQRMKRIVNLFNEQPVDSYPTNFENELAVYKQIQWPIEKSLVTVVGLKNHLDTAMQEILTYLSLQRQKTSIEEQKASREQLEKLVNLQETLHKLEILIVAVYILEMARIIFEAFAHAHVNLFSAVFIPIALIASLAINRILHSDH